MADHAGGCPSGALSQPPSIVPPTVKPRLERGMIGCDRQDGAYVRTNVSTFAIAGSQRQGA